MTIRRIRRFATVCVVAVVAVAGLTACSSSKKTLTFCTDPTYAPAEYYQVAGGKNLKRTLVGSDIDIAYQVAKKVDRQARFYTTNFDKTIPALLDKKCGAIISFMNDTPARRKQVAFVDYLASGQSVMYKKSTQPVTAVNDLFGRTVAVSNGTTEQAFLNSTNQSAQGKSITIQTYPTENDAILAMKNGKAQIYFGDDPIVQFAVAADSSLAQGPQLVKSAPIGIAFRPGDALIKKTTTAIEGMYSDGSMGTILNKWKMGRYAANPGA